MITNYYISVAGADAKALTAQHRRAFPGNDLGDVGGYYKVAVLDGDAAPKGATTKAPTITPSAKAY